MPIPSSLIEDIRAKSDIVNVVERYLPDIKKSGRNWRARCPFHNEKTPSFFISPDKGIYHCFGCGAHGDVFKFVQQIEKISWPEAVKKVGELIGIKVRYDNTENRDETSAESIERKNILNALETAREIYHKTLFETYAGKNALDYLTKNRSLTLETIKKFCIGFSQGDILNTLLQKGFTEETIVKSGLVKPPDNPSEVTESGNRSRYYEYMNGRVVFPIRDRQGKTLAFGGRILDEGRQPKYLNTPESVVYTKGRHLYGFYEGNQSIRKTSEIVIVEGYLDVVVAHQMGIQNAVSCLGTAFTEYHASLVKKTFVRRIALVFDPDAAGLMAAVRASENLMISSGSSSAVDITPLEFYVVTLPSKTDPDEYILQNGSRAFIEYVRKSKKNFFEFHCDYLISRNGGINFIPAERKVSILHSDIFPNVCYIKSPILLQETLKLISDKFNIPPAATNAEYALFVKSRKKYDLKKSNFTGRYQSYSAVKNNGFVYSAQDNGEHPPAIAGSTASYGSGKRRDMILSREETLVAILLSYPAYSSRFRGEMFCDEKCRLVWEKLNEWQSQNNNKDGREFSGSEIYRKIVESFTEDMQKWISSLIFRCPYLDKENFQITPTLLDDIVEKIYTEMENALMSRRLEILKKEIHSMILKGEIDKTKNEEYLSLVRRLKVSPSSSSPPR